MRVHEAYNIKVAARLNMWQVQLGGELCAINGVFAWAVEVR